jgi:VanZ family protein
VARTLARYWLPAIAWTCVVLLASSDTFSAQNTGSILEAVVTTLFGRIDPQTFEVAHFLVRKSAHLTEYAILSLVWFRAWRSGQPGFQWRWGMLGVAVALATAVTDEVHQSFVPSRSGDVRDVLLDLTGALAAQLILWYLLSRRGRVRSAI